MAQIKNRADWNRPYATEVMDWSRAQNTSSTIPHRSRRASMHATATTTVPRPRPVPRPTGQGTGQPSANQTQAQARFSASRVLFALCVSFVLLAMIWMNVAQWGKASGQQRQIASMQQRIGEMQETNVELEAEIDKAMSGEKIRNYAVNKLGMRLPSDEQTRTITKEELRAQGVLVE